MFSLIRVAIMFVLGNFYITVLEIHVDKIKDIELLGFNYMFGDRFIEVIKQNQMIILVTMMALTNFII